jgi:hypothetical protein
VVGKYLLPLLKENRHEVVALTRTPQKIRIVEELGAKPVAVDVLNKNELIAAIHKTEPEVIIHQHTALRGASNFKKFDEEFALTNRFRTEVLDTMLEAHCCISGWTFIVAGITALLIPLFTISVQAIRAAIANPVKKLRTERDGE